MTRKDQIEFLNREIKAQLDAFKITAMSAAKNLLENQQLHIALFQKIEKGQAILKFSAKKAIPRKNEFLLAFIPDDKDKNYHQWQYLSYKQLIENALGSTPSHCIWTAPTDDSNYLLAGFGGFSIEFASKLKPGTAIILGPDAPPVAYLSNLIKVLEKSRDDNFAAALQPNKVKAHWEPLTGNSQPRLIGNLAENDIIMVQGPPGTGKTYLMAQICNDLLNAGKSVLMTALTNRALMELAEKDVLLEKVAEGKVLKFGISTDEAERMPGLGKTDKMLSREGYLCLATYYKMSEYSITAEKTFDFVIADESSQAFLATFAAMMRCGKKQIWIGDPKQLPPVTALSGDSLRKLKALPAITAIDTIAETANVPCFQLTETYRLTQRAADFTGFFYDNKLLSKSNLVIEEDSLPEKLRSLLTVAGGPLWIKTKMEIGEKAPKTAIIKVTELLNELKLFRPENKKPDIAVLSYFIPTVRVLQKEIAQRVNGSGEILVDTVSRIQGLTCDICIYFIPNASLNFSLDNSVFNVATSRARYFTLIISDEAVEISGSEEVKRFLKIIK
jgi:DNA replication ATP-dependent helicase Dna2